MILYLIFFVESSVKLENNNEIVKINEFHSLDTIIEKGPDSLNDLFQTQQVIQPNNVIYDNDIWSEILSTTVNPTELTQNIFEMSPEINEKFLIESNI